MRLNPRLRQVLLAVSIGLVVVVLAGATYQGVATALERRRYPRPGGLIDVGGHQLHLYCTGRGDPTVVLEAAAGGLSASWGLVQPEVAKRTRVCSYDRSGLGWSEAGDASYQPGRVPGELHALLKAADVAPPYVLAGHALGASLARLYADRYPDDVSALVLVDPPAVGPAPDRPLPGLWPWLARTGALRATTTLSAAADGLPDPQAGAVRSFLNRPDHLTRTASEFESFEEAVRLGSQTRQAAPATVVRSNQTAHGVASLNDPAAARRVVAAIMEAVEKVRRAP